jgi:hypothetical protein
MKRRVLLVALLLCAPHLPSFAATPPKAGAICSKAGITKNYNGKKYTCTKSGKKLIWSKGTLIKVAQPMPTPTPTRTPIPTATPTPIETSAPIKPKYISSQSEFALATEIAIANVWAKAKPVPANYKIFVEPGWENSPYAVETQKLIQATVDFVTALGAPLTTDTKIYMPWNWSWVQKYANPKSYCFNATWVGGAYCGDGFHIQNLAHFNNFFKTGFEPLPSEPAIRQALLRQLSHELAHQSQADHLLRFERNTSFYPAWLREGAPEIISMAAYMKVFGVSYLEVRDLYFNFTSPFCRNTKISDLLMAGNAEYDCQGTNGVLATEALIATTGNFESVYAFGASKIPQNGPRFFQDREGISDETYKFVMTEMYGIDIQKWHPIVDNYIKIWATCSYERNDTNCKFIR